MPTKYLKLPYVDTVLRPDSLRPIVLAEGPVGYSVDIRLNYYRGQPLSAIEQLELKLDGETVPSHLMLLEYNRNLYRLEELSLAFNEFWALKKPLRALVYQGELAAGEHELDLTLILRNVSMWFGPGRWGMVDSSAKRTLTLGGGGVKLDTIEQGISLYGFNQRYVEDLDYAIEDCYREVQGFGVQKFELVGAVFFEQYPRPRADEVERVLAGAERFGLTPFSYGGYIDKGRITGHEPTDDDVIYWLTADLMTARDLGCEKLRAGSLPPNLLPLAATLAERYGIDIGIEVHAPSKPSDRNIQELLAEFERIGSSRLGFVPDFGCFIERPAEPALQRYEREGASRELLEYIIANRHSGVSEQELYEDVTGRGGGQAERMAISDFFGFLSFAPADVDGFRTLLPWTHYIHSKFYHVTADFQDPTIPMDRLLAAVREERFDGVLMTEYEGHAFHLDDAHEQIERHLKLEQQILG